MVFMKKRKIVIGNWKMNPSTELEARELFKKLKAKSKKFKGIEVVICPPALHTALFKKTTEKNFSLGVQNVFSEQRGAYTGEVSAEMVSDVGATYTILGHSERRALGETDAMIAKKVLGAIATELTVVLCVGEKERDSGGVYFEFLKNQIKNSLSGIKPGDLRKVIIAYEPVWAIGKSFKDAMKPAEVYEMTIFIKKVLSDIFGKDPALLVPILYGGSANFENAEAIFKEGNVNGFLLGRESLNPDNFGKLLTVIDVL